MHDAPKPESFEKHLLFGCGFIFGALGAFLYVAPHLTEFPIAFVASVSVAANLFGILAVYCGDKFLRNRAH